MQAIAVSMTPSKMTRSTNRPVTRTTPVAQTAPAPDDVVEYRSGNCPNSILAIGALLIVALLDLNFALWMLPAASQIAEWAGASLMNSIYVGIAGAGVALPVGIAVSICAWRRISR